MADERKKNHISMMVSKTEEPPSSNKSTANMANKSSGKLTGTDMSRLKMRKMSYGFGVGQSAIRGLEKDSQIAIEFKRPPLLYLNTYQLDPHPDQVFDVPEVTKMVNSLLDQLWTGHTYNVSETPALALRLAGELARKVKHMNFNRYRGINIVTIGQKRAQSYNNAISFLWDHERDKYVDVQRECTTCFIHITIFGIYLD